MIWGKQGCKTGHPLGKWPVFNGLAFKTGLVNAEYAKWYLADDLVDSGCFRNSLVHDFFHFFDFFLNFFHYWRMVGNNLDRHHGNDIGMQANAHGMGRP